MSDDRIEADLTAHTVAFRDHDGGPIVDVVVELVDLAGRPARAVAHLTPDEADELAWRLREEATRARAVQRGAVDGRNGHAQP